MPRIAYVNGQYLPHSDASVHIEDRGYQFADGVYEVVPVMSGKLVDEARHLDRLERSLSELQMDMPMSRRALQLVCDSVIERNYLTNGFVYMQVTRGVAPRDHKFPKGIKPAIVITAKQTKPQSTAVLEDGVAVKTVPDIRWRRRDIKSISLLPNCMAKQAAVEEGAFEAWMVEEDGTVTEGSSTNAWIVTKDGILVTRTADHDILNGITRMGLLEVAAEAGVQFEERPFTLEEAYEAREAFLTSSTNHVTPITRIDDRSVANGKPGSVTMKLREAYLDRIARE
ncbi:D-amino-acid transaminase [Fodinicurvata halophila]|uniref:D-alanine aminotransferase n=1 Tax=Fodinicurvata halophila TaxID=1419723 RepID=A0ABV8UKM1_9PROT